MNLTGPCPVDIDKAVKCWTKRSIISKWNDEYRIIRYTHARHVAMKVTISIKDAQELIKRLELEELPCGIFKNASDFVVKGIRSFKDLSKPEIY